MIELEPILNYGIEIFVLLLSGVAAWVGKAVRDKFNIDKENELWKVLDEEMKGAVDIAEAYLKKQGKNIDIETSNELVERAGNFLAEQAPKTLKRTGLSPQAVANRLEKFAKEKIQ